MFVVGGCGLWGLTVLHLVAGDGVSDIGRVSRTLLVPQQPPAHTPSTNPE